eukprot:CAMPEP_0179153482 /NCGR_PEP_ID=MMETSP0796-20121207/74639_1 /TAXON_ID=73915 /ORGANISM="Pyrodinium bahamense, Strain pbaha01" /LENGTH=75 /DNA_ID=CAMNT_0020854767 /DNA_START=46 /DNA_END=270 /DNA_ORIENTATION=-
MAAQVAELMELRAQNLVMANELAALRMDTQDLVTQQLLVDQQQVMLTRVNKALKLLVANLAQPAEMTPVHGGRRL